MAGIVIVMITITATPRPNAVLTVLETARNVHIPRKKASARFSAKIEAKNIRRCSSTQLSLLFHLIWLKSPEHPNKESNNKFNNQLLFLERLLDHAGIKYNKIENINEEN